MSYSCCFILQKDNFFEGGYVSVVEHLFGRQGPEFNPLRCKQTNKRIKQTSQKRVLFDDVVIIWLIIDSTLP